MPSNNTLTINNLKLEYRAIGDTRSSKETIVMLHEGLGCVSLWNDFPERLAEATGWRVIAYSRSGYGSSSPCDLPRPLTYMHDEAFQVLPGILDQVGFDGGILLGHSDGASIAAIYAGAHSDERLRGLILIAPHFFTEPAGLEAIEQARGAFVNGDLRPRLEKHHKGNVDCAFWGWCNAWLDSGFEQWDIRKYLSDISQPVLAIQGANDEYGSLKQLDELEASCRAPVTRLIIPNCGHAPHREKPTATLSAVQTLINRLG